VLSRALRLSVPHDDDADSAVVHDSDSDPDLEEGISANLDLPVGGLERMGSWGCRICSVSGGRGSGGRYRLAMAPSSSRYVICMEAVQRFEASGGLLPLNPRLGRPRRQLRVPRHLVCGTVCGGESSGSSGSSCYGDSNSGGGGVGDDGGRMDGRGDRGRGASDGGGGGKGGHVSFVSSVGPLCLALPGASLAQLAGMQAQLIHSINNRASSVAALQQSAGACGRYHLGLSSHPAHIHTILAPRSSADCRSNGGGLESNGSCGRKEGSDGDSCSNGGGGIADENGGESGDEGSSGGGIRYSDDGEEGDHNRCSANGCCADGGGGIDVDDGSGSHVGGGGGKGSCGSSRSCGDDDGRADDGSSVADDVGGSESRSYGRDDGGDGGIYVVGVAGATMEVLGLSIKQKVHPCWETRPATRMR
jgi:hypothetical protein